MKIKEILSHCRREFTAMIECEHCGEVAKLTSGYYDDHYHFRVMPAMPCITCGKNRAGGKQHEN